MAKGKFDKSEFEMTRLYFCASKEKYQMSVSKQSREEKKDELVCKSTLLDDVDRNWRIKKTGVVARA